MGLGLDVYDSVDGILLPLLTHSTHTLEVYKSGRMRHISSERSE